jgi:broad specificity phosphatase PhoE
MLKIYLARHGQDEDNFNGILNGRRDKPLTKKGIEQAEEATRKTRELGFRFDKVYTSPLKRTRATAEIIASGTNSPTPEILGDLIERDFGIMTGQPHSRIVEMCSPDILKSDDINYFLKPEGAETFPELLKRADGVLTEVRERHSDGNILLVTHSDFGKMIYTAYYKLNWKEVLKMFHFGNAELLELSEESSPEDVRVFEIKQHRM